MGDRLSPSPCERYVFLVGVSFICALPCIMDEESICGTQGIIMGCDLVPYDWIFVIVEGGKEVRSLCHGDPVTDELILRTFRKRHCQWHLCHRQFFIIKFDARVRVQLG